MTVEETIEHVSLVAACTLTPAFRLFGWTWYGSRQEPTFKEIQEFVRERCQSAVQTASKNEETQKVRCSSGRIAVEYDKELGEFQVYLELPR